MVNPNRIYICSRCERAHKSEEGAINCCPSEVIEQYECESCGTQFDTIEEATNCCGEDEVE